MGMTRDGKLTTDGCLVGGHVLERATCKVDTRVDSARLKPLCEGTLLVGVED